MLKSVLGIFLAIGIERDSINIENDLKKYELLMFFNNVIINLKKKCNNL